MHIKIRKKNFRRTHIELSRVSIPNRFALVDELVEEQEPPEPVLPHEPRETQERQHCDAAERQLHDTVEGPRVVAVAGGARQQEMRGRGHDDPEENEHGPGETRRPHVRLVDAHPPEIGSEAV